MGEDVNIQSFSDIYECIKRIENWISLTDTESDTIVEDDPLWLLNFFLE